MPPYLSEETLTRDEYDPTKNQIHGFMREIELDWLYMTAKKMDSIVEIGSWMGRSAHALLSGCKGTVYCVDHFKGNPSQRNAEHEIATKQDISEEFLKNVGHFHNLWLMKMSSLEAASKFKDGEIDMVFIDGDHGYEAVMNDFEAWYPKCKKIICGHDFDQYSVKQAVCDSVGKLRLPKFRTYPETCLWEVVK
jgi:precorrin-6B methylase 2